MAGIKTVLIDLDDCLYDIEEFPRLMASNIQRYMEHRLDFPGHNIKEVCADLYMGHGTTLAGLVSKGYRIDFDDWHAHAHSVLPYELVQPDPALKAVLQGIPLPKWVFTNADVRHAEECLARLGIRDCFQGVICFETTMAAGAAAGIVQNGRPVLCKPNRLAIELALAAAGGAEAASTLFCDDSLRNIAGGKTMGLRTVLIAQHGQGGALVQLTRTCFLPVVGKTGCEHADYEVKSLHQLPATIPELFSMPGPQNGLPAALAVPAANGSAAELAASETPAASALHGLSAANGAVRSPAAGAAEAGDAVDAMLKQQRRQHRAAQQLPSSPTCRQQAALAEETVGLPLRNKNI